ncbi:hypothetical protein [Streptomyces sp. NPDC058614]|uniref:hypothetical protein n=1 Tax=Streptomyces sp. NPDC058614 TaxID=3346557 RepID=UPI00365E5A43
MARGRLRIYLGAAPGVEMDVDAGGGLTMVLTPRSAAAQRPPVSPDASATVVY